MMWTPGTGETGQATVGPAEGPFPHAVARLLSHGFCSYAAAYAEGGAHLTYHRPRGEKSSPTTAVVALVSDCLSQSYMTKADSWRVAGKTAAHELFDNGHV